MNGPMFPLSSRLLLFTPNFAGVNHTPTGVALDHLVNRLVGRNGFRYFLSNKIFVFACLDFGVFIVAVLV